MTKSIGSPAPSNSSSSSTVGVGREPGQEEVERAGRAGSRRRCRATTSRNSPPRSSGVSGCSRCHSPSLSGERTSSAAERRGVVRRSGGLAAARDGGSVIGRCGGSRRPRRGGRAASRPSACSRPGIDDAGRRGGGDELELRDAEPAVERAVGDVDELHPAVGHGDEALPEDAAAEDEVVLAQLVADRARLPRQDREGPPEDDGHDAAGDPGPRLVQDRARARASAATTTARNEPGRDELHPDVLAARSGATRPPRGRAGSRTRGSTQPVEGARRPAPRQRAVEVSRAASVVVESGLSPASPPGCSSSSSFRMVQRCSATRPADDEERPAHGRRDDRAHRA